MRFTRKNGLTTLALLCAGIGAVQALPVNPVFRLGAGNYSASGSSATLNLTTFNAKNTALIDWDSFNIGKPDLLTFKDKTGNSTSKNVVNQTSTASTIAGSVTADQTLKLIVVSPNGVSVAGTAAISAGGFAAFSGNTTVQPSGQVLITGTPGAVSLAAGAAVNRSGGNSLSVAPAGEIAFEIPTGTTTALPLLGSRDSLRVNTPLAGQQAGTMSGQIQAGTIDAGGNNVTLTGTANQGTASVQNAGAVVLQNVTLGQGTLSQAARWEYGPDGKTLVLTEPGAAGVRTAFDLTVGSASAPVGSLTLTNVKTEGLSRFNGYTGAFTTTGTANKVNGAVTASGAVRIGGTFDGGRSADPSGYAPYTAGSGYMTVRASGDVVLDDVQVTKDHVIDVQLVNPAPVTLTGSKATMDNGSVYIRTLGSDVALNNWTLTGSNSNLFSVTGSKDTVNEQGQHMGGTGFLDVNITGLTSAGAAVRIENAGVKTAGIRDLTISGSTISQPDGAGLFVQVARKATLTNTTVSLSGAGKTGDRTYITTTGYSGESGEVVLNNSNVRGVDVLIGGGYGQTENADMSAVTAVDPTFIPGVTKSSGDFLNSGSFWDGVMGKAGAAAGKMSYDPVTGKLDAVRNTGAVTLTGSVVEGNATVRVGAKNTVTVDAGSRVEALNVGTEGITLASGGQVVFQQQSKLIASQANMVNGLEGGAPLLQTPRITQSDGSAKAQALITGKTVTLNGTLKAGGSDQNPQNTVKQEPCVASPTSCYNGTPFDGDMRPKDFTGHILDAPITGNGTPIGGGVPTFDPGEFPLQTPVVVGTPNVLRPIPTDVVLRKPTAPTSPTTPLPTRQTPGSVIGVTVAPGTYAMPDGTLKILTDGSITSTPADGTTIHLAPGDFKVAAGGTAAVPIVGQHYSYAGKPDLTYTAGPGTGYTAAPAPGTTATSDGLTWQVSNSGVWVAQTPAGITRAQDGTTYTKDNTGSTWSVVPVAGSTARSNDGVTYVYGTAGWSIQPGQTVTSGGLPWVVGADGTLVPPAGSTRDANGKTYAFTLADGAGVWAPAQGTNITDGTGRTFTYGSTGWTPVFTPGETTAANGKTYTYSAPDGAFIWTPAPAQLGDTSTSGGIVYVYGSGGWLPQAGQTTTANDVTYISNGSGGWTPAAGSSISSGGKTYSWDSGSNAFVWAPQPGEAIAKAGLIYTYQDGQWVYSPTAGQPLVSVPAAGTLMSENGVSYTWDSGFAGWKPVAGSTMTDAGKTYAWDTTGSAWVVQVPVGSTTVKNGVTYEWSGTAWAPAVGSAVLDAGKTYVYSPTSGGSFTWVPKTGETVTKDGVTYTYTPAGWAVAAGSSLTKDGVTYEWSGTAWAPEAGSTVTNGGKTYVYSPADGGFTWTPKTGETVTKDGVTYTYTPGGWTVNPGSSLTKDGVTFTYTAPSGWTPAPGSTLTDAGKPYTWNPEKTAWTTSETKPVLVDSTGKLTTNSPVMASPVPGVFTAAVEPVRYTAPASGTVNVSRDEVLVNTVATVAGGGWVSPAGGKTGTWDNLGITPANGATLSQNGSTYIWDSIANAWSPSAGTTTAGGKASTPADWIFNPWTGTAWAPATGTAVPSAKPFLYAYTPNGWTSPTSSFVPYSYPTTPSGWTPSAWDPAKIKWTTPALPKVPTLVTPKVKPWLTTPAGKPLPPGAVKTGKPVAPAAPGSPAETPAVPKVPAGSVQVPTDPLTPPKSGLPGAVDVDVKVADCAGSTVFNERCAVIPKAQADTPKNAGVLPGGVAPWQLYYGAEKVAR